MGIVQVAQASAATTTVTATFANNIAAGNSVVVCIEGYATVSGTFIGSVSPSSGADTYTQAISDINTDDSSIWYILSSAGGYKSVTVTSNQTGYGANVWIYEVATLTALDKTSNGPGGTGTSFTSNATATTTQANEIWFGVGGGVGVASSSDTASGPAGWTNESSQNYNNPVGGQCAGVSGYKIVSSTGTATYSGTISSSSTETGCVATFKYTPTFQAVVVPQRRQAVMRASVY